MTDELEALINDGEPEEAQESETTPETDTQETEAETEQADKGEETEETTESEQTESSEESKQDDETPSSDEESWTKAMALDERRKRQALEEELRELRKKVESSQESDDSAPDPTEDPEGYREYLRNEIRSEYRRDMINKSRQKIINEKGDDYLEKEKVFMDLTKENPRLVDKMNESWDPAQFAYDTAVDHLQQEEIRKAGGIEKWREQERERLKKELQDNQAQESESTEKPKVEQVPSLATASSASGGFATPTDDSLSDVALGDNV